MNIWDTVQNNARNFWGELKRTPQDIKGLLGDYAQVRHLMKQGGNVNPDQAAQYAMDFLQTTPVGALGKIVYHGSPHKFNKFDMSKIGTGEGAQAYGHGLYFAEAPDVAQSYQALGHMKGNIAGRISAN